MIDSTVHHAPVIAPMNNNTKRAVFKLALQYLYQAKQEPK